MYHCYRSQGGWCLCPDGAPKKPETFEPWIDIKLKTTAAPIVKHQARQASKQVEDHEKPQGLEARGASTDSMGANRHQSRGNEDERHELETILVMLEQH